MLIRKIVVSIFSALAFSLFITAPAISHSELAGSVPAADEIITTWPTQVILTFNEDLITTEGQQVNFLTVSDSAGAQIDLMDSTVSGSSISVSLPQSASSGSYYVNYRVVSADGHVIEDSYEFVFDGGESETAVPINETESDPVPTAYTTEEESSSNLGLILGLVTLASFVLLIYQFRKNRYK